jgi:LacI family transcriptional regulator, galactose operon repressor
LAVRMIDIARELGVSLMTVSKALRNHTDISVKTRDRVLQRARRLGYHPNWVARSLATSRTYMVGLVIPDLMHSFFAEVAKGIVRKLDPLGYQVIMTNSEGSCEAEDRQIGALMSRKIDGIIVASAETRSGSETLSSLRSGNFPLVLIDRRPPGIDANYVGVRDEEVGSLATQHLMEQGCRRIAHIRGPANSTGTGRLRGYRRVLAKHGREMGGKYIVKGGSGDDSGYQAMRRLMKLDPRPDGVFCYNDPVAMGAIKAALDAGLKIPGDVAIIGAGNVHYSDLLRISLSTIDQGSCLIGETAAGLLADCMENKSNGKTARILIPPRLVARDSTRRGGSHVVEMLRPSG